MKHAIKTPISLEKDIKLYAECLSWYDFVDEANCEAFKEWGWSIADDEILAARSALELLCEFLDAETLDLLDDADRYWRQHKVAFDHMFAIAHAEFEPETALAYWVTDEQGNPIPVPESHWWWRQSSQW